MVIWRYPPGRAPGIHAAREPRPDSRGNILLLFGFQVDAIAAREPRPDSRGNLPPQRHKFPGWVAAREPRPDSRGNALHNAGRYLGYTRRKGATA